MVNSREPLTRILYFRVTEAQAKHLEEYAKASGVLLSEILRAAVLRYKLKPPAIPRIELQAVGELARIGNNLNQLTKWANAGRFSPEVKPELDELRELTMEIRTRILAEGRAGEDRGDVQ